MASGCGNLKINYKSGTFASEKKLSVYIQWGSKIQTSLDFEWSKRGWVANVLDFEWDLKS